MYIESMTLEGDAVVDHYYVKVIGDANRLRPYLPAYVSNQALQEHLRETEGCSYTRPCRDSDTL